MENHRNFGDNDMNRAGRGSGTRSHDYERNWTRQPGDWGRDESQRWNFDSRGFEGRQDINSNWSASGFGTAGRFGNAERPSSIADHTGRGPKGYQRTDERIREEVCDCLTRDSQVDASEIEVQVKNAEVTLSGTVTERSQKRRAEDIVEDVSGIKEVHNQIRVQHRQDDSPSETTHQQQTIL